MLFYSHFHLAKMSLVEIICFQIRGKALAQPLLFVSGLLVSGRKPSVATPLVAEKIPMLAQNPSVKSL